MGNLAEAAAEAIGANPLLARVGAYYHDIGKTVRPEYFVENQIYVDNPHNRLNPNLSKLAITAHVRDGEHLARLYGLPQPVVDIIKQHHGTSVLPYFYHKALESSKDAVYEESYRYEEQKPRSKEAVHRHAGRQRRGGRAGHAEPHPAQDPGDDPGDHQAEDGGRPAGRVRPHPGRPAQDPGLVRQSLRGLVGHRIAYPERDGQEAPSLVQFPETLASETLVDGLSPGVPEAPVPPPVTRPRVPPSAAALRAKRTSEAGSMGSAAAANSEVVICPSLVRRYALEEAGLTPGRQLGWTVVYGTLDCRRRS